MAHSLAAWQAGWPGTSGPVMGVPCLTCATCGGSRCRTGGSAGSVAAVIIRDATNDDWPRIWPFFQHIVAAGESYAFPLDLDLDTGRPWWMEQPPGRPVVAVDGDRVLGSPKMGPNRPVGRALGEHVLAWARAAGYRSMQFNAVVETNTPAVTLWKALGFTVIGTVPEAFDHPSH